MRLRNRHAKTASPVAHLRMGHRADLLGGFTDIEPTWAGAVLQLIISVGRYQTVIQAHIGTGDPLELLVNGEPTRGVVYEALRDWMSRNGVRMPLVVEISCHAPRGSGLGTSSQLVAGSIATMTRVLGKPLSRVEIARIAYVCEHPLDGCGWQDVGPLGGGPFVFASAPSSVHLGGVRPRYERIRVARSVIAELEGRALLAWTGESHFSGDNLEHVRRRILGGNPGAIRAWDRLRELAIRGRRLLRGNGSATEVVDELGRLVAANWESEIALVGSPVECPKLTSLAPQLRGLGFFKLLGAGGGGHLWVIAGSPSAKSEARIILESAGLSVVPWSSERHPAMINNEYI